MISQITPVRGDDRSVRFGCVVLLALTIACGTTTGNENGDEPTGPLPDCGIGTRLTGAVSDSFSVSDDAACSVLEITALPGMRGSVDVLFHPEGPVQSFELLLAEILEGETGSGFRGAVAITLEDGIQFVSSTSACTLTVSENRHVSTDPEQTPLGQRKNYQIVGTGTCTEAAVGTTGDVTVGPMSFRIPAVWRY
jgi:hypothetical protein